MFLEEKNQGESQKSKLEQFIYQLRHPELWPEGFEWNYHSCDTCAMGLAHALGYINFPLSGEMMKTFNIPDEAARRIFLHGNPRFIFFHRYEPKQIAKSLEKYVKVR